MITRETAIRATAAMVPRLLDESGLGLSAEIATDVVAEVSELLERLVPADCPIAAHAEAAD